MSDTDQPPSNDSLNFAKQVDALCDEFEKLCIDNAHPKIESFLLRCDNRVYPQLLIELIAIEVHYRRSIGEAFELSEYQLRFPDLPTSRLDATINESREEAANRRGNVFGRETATLDDRSYNVVSDENMVVKYFGEYELLAVIARGGMGIVYKARQASLKRIVALKMILSGEFASNEEIDRFYFEARAAALLDHPGIVPIYEVGEHEGKHYFSMAFVEGISLAMKLREGPLEPKVAAQTIVEICDAVQYAHEKGIIHRDLKPSNILLDSKGRTRVTDFGLAKQLSEPNGATLSGQVLGTPNYMPPEQASGRICVVGPAADVYALGAVLYALTTGHPPFQGASSVDTLRQVIEKEPRAPRQLNPSLPRDLETIILKSLEKSLPRRYASASELANELKRFLEGRPILARPLSRIGKTLRSCRRNPIAAVLTSIVGFMMFAAAIVTIWLIIEVQQIRRQRPILQALQNLGGEFIFASVAPAEWLEDVFNEELFLVGVNLFFSKNNDVTDVGLARLHELSQLEGLSLMDTSVTDAGLLHVGKMKRLNRLNLSGTQITNAGMSHLAHLTELQELNLSGTNITIDGLDQIRGLSKLLQLDVTDTQIKHEDVVKLYGPRGPRFFIRYGISTETAGNAPR